MADVERWQKINLWASAAVLADSVVNMLLLAVDRLHPIAERPLLAVCAALLAVQSVAVVWLVVSTINLRKCAGQQGENKKGEQPYPEDNSDMLCGSGRRADM